MVDYAAASIYHNKKNATVVFITNHLQPLALSNAFFSLVLG